MNEKPITFNTEMVQAILEGNKTQTRRAIKCQMKKPASGHYLDAYNKSEEWFWWSEDHRQNLEQKITCPFGKVGDRLWVRETFKVVPRTAYAQSEGVQQVIKPNDNHDAAIFKAGWDRSKPGRWKPARHMPRWASRITLEITDIRVERLQDISEEDAVAEGFKYEGWVPTYNDPDSGGDGNEALPSEKFADMWESIYQNWDSNPWVWVIDFKVVKT